MSTPTVVPLQTAPSKRSTPNVAYVRPEFTDLKPRWELVRDCIAGQEQVKKRGDQYLPRPNPTDVSEENKSRYEQYKARAVFYNVTGRTLNGLVGQVFAEEPKADLPQLLAVMEKDADGAGVSLHQQSQRALSHGLSFGRAGLLVDYPPVDGATTKKDLEDAKVRPTIVLLDPWDIINWRTLTVGGVTKLSLVVISEQYVTDDDGFEQALDDQWRVLRLDDEGLYVVEEWIRDPNNKEEFILKPTDNGPAQYFPTDSKGQRLDYIPFTFIGAGNNDPQPDLPPLFDLASLNIAHYRNSADYEEAAFICGQPTPVLAGLTEDWVKDVLKGSVQLGSRTAIPLPEGGSATLLQATENTMPFEAMEHKERQMVALGAKLVEQKTVQRTATEAGMDNASEVSVLSTVANNVSKAYRDALNFALRFVDAGSVKAEDTPELFQLNTDFTIGKLTPQERQQLISEWQGGAITFEEMRSNLRRAGVAYLDDEEAKSTLESEAAMRPVTATGQPGDPAEGGAPADNTGAVAQ